MKKIFILYIILLLSFYSQAQTWKQLNTQFIEQYNNEEFEKAIATGEKAKLAAKKEFGEIHRTYALSLYNLATAYLETGEYKKAEPLFIQAKTIQQKVLGEKDPDYATTLNDLARLYTETKQYAKAEPIYLQAKQIRLTVLGEDDPDYSITLNDLATLYLDMGKNEKAEPLYLDSKRISEKLTGTSDPEYIATISNLGILYERMNLYEKAEPLYLEASKFYKDHPGEKDADYDASLDDLASLYDKMGQYEKSRDYYLLSAALNKKQYGEVSPEYARVINRLALIYTGMAEYDKAEQLYLQIAETRKKVLGDGHPDYGTALNNLASHYFDMGQYEKAESYYLQALEIAQQNPDKSNTDYLTVVNNMAMLYMKKGKYDFAEPLLIKLKEAKKKVFGENDPSYAVSLSNLGNVYFNTGQYEKAIPLYIAAMAIIKKVIGEQSPDYVIPLQNLAYVYAMMGQSAKSESLYLQAIAIRKKISGENTPEYATLLDNRALFYSNKGEYLKAESLYIQAKNIRKKLFGEMNPDYASSLNNLASYYLDVGKYDLAEPLFIQAKEIIKNVLGEDHPDYAVAVNNLSELYVKTGQFKKAEPGLIQASKIVLQNILNTFTVLSESEKNIYLEKNISLIETNNSFLYQYKNASPEIAINNFNLQLVFKSASLADTKNMMESLQYSPDTSIRRLFSAWMNNRNILAKQYSLPANSRRNDLEKIEEQTEAQEKDLNVLSSDFRNQKTALQVSIKDVQKNLQTDEVAIEFVRFQLLNGKWKDSMIYAAYILYKNDTVPKFVPLCEEKQLQRLLDSAGKTSATLVNKFYRGMDIKNKNAAFLGDSLYKLIWQPLEPYLKGIKKISYSPAGKLYSIAFHALPVDSNTLLMDKYQLQQYTSTRQIAMRSASDLASSLKSITLFGDASFTMDSLQLVKKRNNQVDNVSATTYVVQNRGSRGGTWNNLPGTALEVKKIQQLFDQNKISTKLYTQANASEENLKVENGNSPQVLHIATHGFFLPEPGNRKKEQNQNTYTLADDPLLRSGLVLAGGNYAWSGKTPVSGVEDGIVTAYEISQLNLSNTELVVLSACETALGDIKGSEGVFGLQRAFKMAGVKKMIVSLWQVPDKETAELMTTFYSYWLNGKNTEESFYRAQADIRKKYTPFYWAAFVLVE